LTPLIYPVQSPRYKAGLVPRNTTLPSPLHFLHHLLNTLTARIPPLFALSNLAMQSLYGNTTTSTSRSSQRVGDTHNSRRHNLIGPSRTRPANRHNPYATAVSEQDTNGSTLKGQRRNRREGRLRSSVKRVSIHLN
jgi:hypothetical protein